MDIERIHPELRARAARLRLPDLQKPFLRGAVRIGLRLQRTRIGAGVSVHRVRSEGVRMRVYVPANATPGPALLWFHGGGYVMGTPHQDDALLVSTARALGVPIFSVDYRVAPEHPFPAAHNDGYAAWRWLQLNVETWQVDAARVVVGGESAGGGLAAALVQRLVDEDGNAPMGQWLFCPMLDDRTAARRELDDIDHPVWNNASNLFGWTAYLGKAPGSQSMPEYAVPSRRESLEGLPPTWICAGDVELFFDEDRAYAQQLREGGSGGRKRHRCRRRARL